MAAYTHRPSPELCPIAQPCMLPPRREMTAEWPTLLRPALWAQEVAMRDQSPALSPVPI
jgi:hypothetical protein